jgi:CheY-like chemotaxis protein
VDAVVADLAMPHVDGFALIAQIRHLATTRFGRYRRSR